jgi:hypothetical protein
MNIGNLQTPSPRNPGRLTARWPPLLASEASGYALLATAHAGMAKAVSLARPQTDRAVVGRATIDRAMRTSTPAALDGATAEERRG